MGITLEGILKIRPTLLTEFDIPEGMDRMRLSHVIRWRVWDMDVVHADPDMMGWAIKSWAEQHRYKWDGLWKSLNYEYDLFINIDYVETTKELVKETGKRDGTIKDDGTAHSESYEQTEENNTGNVKKTGKDNTKTSGTEDRTGHTELSGSTDTTGEGAENSTESNTKTTDMRGTSSGDSTTADNYQGFNSATYQRAKQQVGDNDTRTTESGTVKDETTGHKDNNTKGHSESSSKSDETGKTTSSGTEERTAEESTDSTGKTTGTSKGNGDVKTGNIRESGESHEDDKIREVVHTMRGDSSVRSAPSVIQEERALYNLDVYAIIADDFKEAFCVMAYNF